ncbi:CoA transferase [Lactiplantibacillus plantarum]|uniref:CoA transferase n=1 Tax=Lactiplantibacillus plantarum TaxID=1590 RepID=UPI0040454634
MPPWLSTPTERNWSKSATRIRSPCATRCLYTDLAAIVALRGTDDWLALLADADIPHSRVNPPEALFDDPHLAATGFFQRVEHPTEGALTATAIPVRFSRTPGSIRRLAPRQDADRDMLDGQGSERR